MHRGDTIAIAVVLGTAICTASAWLAAGPLDPTLPQHITVGQPSGPAPMERLSPDRGGRSIVAFPTQPRVLWRVRVMGSPQRAIAVDARGAVVVASDTHLTQISADGKVEWKVRLGPTRAASAPIITSSGARWLLTSDGDLLGVDRDGRTLWRQTLPVTSAKPAGQMLPTSDGGAVVPVGSEVFRLESDGRVRTRIALDEMVSSVIQNGADLLLVGVAGGVFRWKPPVAVTPLGSLGGRPEGSAALADPNTLIAVVDGNRLMEMDLRSGSRRARVPDGTYMFYGSPAITARGETRVFSSDGFLLGHNAKGEETWRVALTAGDQRDAGTATTTAGRPAPLVVDHSGAVAFVAGGLELGVASKSGKVSTVSGAACATPVSLVPAGKHRLALACVSGLVWMIGS